MIRQTRREARSFRDNGRAAMARIICVAIPAAGVRRGWRQRPGARERPDRRGVADAWLKGSGFIPVETPPGMPAVTPEIYEASPGQVLGERSLDILELAMAFVVAVATLTMGLFGARRFARESLESSRAWLDSVYAAIAARNDSAREAEPPAAAIPAIKLREALLVGAGAACFAAAFSYPILGRLSSIGIIDDWAEHLQPNWAGILLDYSLSPGSAVESISMRWHAVARPSSVAGCQPLFALQIIFGPS